MKQRIVLLAIAWVICLVSTMAENVIQVTPTTAKPGTTAEDMAYLSFEMTNTDAIIGYEFKIKLPEGMDFDNSDPENAPPFELKLDPRYPYTGRTKTYHHSVNYTKRSDGWWYVIVSSSQLNAIKGNSGEIMKGYFLTDANMPPGVYPIIIKETILGISGSQAAETAEMSVSYITVTADGSTSALDSKADIDLSGMTGYVPSFVVEQLNTDMAANTNLRTVNLSGATELGAELSVPENVVYAVGTKGGLKRSFAAQKSTVCLPFALSADQVSTIKAKGCDIEQLASFDAETNTVSFAEVDEMEANVPYLITCNTAGDMFDGIENFSFGALTAPADITKGDLTMKGAFEKTTITSGGDYTYYAYKAADGKFVKVGTTATVNPFRAYLAKKGSNGARYLNIAGDDATAIHGIQEVEATGQEGTLYNLQGVKASGTQKGLYIKDGKKYVVN